jgi:hypothetical protein
MVKNSAKRTLVARKREGFLSYCDGRYLNSPDIQVIAGCLVFLGDASLVGPAQSNELHARIGSLKGSERALVWVEKRVPDEEDNSGLHVIRFNESGNVTEDALIPFGGLSLSIPAGSAIDHSGDGTRLIISAAADAARPMTFAARASYEGGEIKDQRIEIPINESSESGGMVFSASIPISALEASVRYFYKDHSQREVSNNGAPQLGGFYYPVFESSATAEARVDASIDPSRPTDTLRSNLQLTGGGSYKTNFRSTLGHAISLTAIAGQSGIGSQWDPLLKRAYTVLLGNWRVGVNPAQTSGVADENAFDFMLGLSGVEYGRVADGSIMRFEPGGPSYSPNFMDPSAQVESSLIAQCPGSEYEVTTAWIYFADNPAGPTGLSNSISMAGPTGATYLKGYYSQPYSAGLFTPMVEDNFLQVLNLRAGSFPPSATGVLGAQKASFPMVPYAGVTVTSGGDASPADLHERFTRFEMEVLSPTRNLAIYEMNKNAQSQGPVGVSGFSQRAGEVFSITGPSGPTGPTGPSGPTRTAVTPQGLLSDFSIDLTTWQSLTLARTENGAQTLRLTNVRDELRFALLTNQLFLVVSNPQMLFDYFANGLIQLEQCSLVYRITDRTLIDVAAPPEVKRYVRYMVGVSYESLEYFQPALRNALGEEYFLQYGKAFIDRSAVAELSISGWKFDLSPDRWDAKTVMIIKFAEGELKQLIDDLSLWTMADEFNTDPSKTQQTLKQTVSEAIEKAKTEPEFEYFAATVLKDWNGIMFLNCYVPPSEFPPELRGLAAGINYEEFRAHHLGINVASFKVQNHRIRSNDSSLFGLIFYDDTADLIYTGNPYDFKVLTLRVLFANSEIASFASQIQLLVGALFGEPSSLVESDHGDNLILNGVWQKHGDQDSYVFTQQGNDVFLVTSRVVESVVITNAQFVTVIPESGLAAGADVATRFVLRGSMRFRPIPDFDLFSFGAVEITDPVSAGGRGLQFSNMVIEMTFNPDTQSETLFEFVAGEMLFDLSQSVPRSGSLYRKFPLQVTGMVQGNATTKPGDLGYIIVESPIGTGPLGAVWFGLEMSMSLGSPGSLASKAGFSATLLAAWAPTQANYNIAIGIRLPGSEGGNKALTIEGPLKLDIGNISIIYNKEEQGYLMRFQNIALGFLGLKFPPGGKVNLLLFGDPNPSSKSSSLGWYAAYMKDKPKPAKPEARAIPESTLLRID